jgi:RES domain-containing protein
MLKEYSKLFRNCKYNNLSGQGGVNSEGRWNKKGIAVVYTSEHPALSLVEKLVHSNLAFIPPKYKRLNITNQQHVSLEEVTKLPAAWQTNRNWTIDYGSEWLQSRRTVALKVPSVIMPDAYNYLLNPHHPDMIHFTHQLIEVDYDERLRASTPIVNELRALASLKFGTPVQGIQWFGISNIKLKGKTPLDVLENLHIEENQKLLPRLYDLLRLS